MENLGRFCARCKSQITKGSAFRFRMMLGDGALEVRFGRTVGEAPCLR
jgi:hypothetical protein